ncbi:hypothetical protein PTSG_04535 [Salpingoeca rosetta]|uniref:C-CAP/cofactor C-like domain-containing protein n=1 Tax=Salpingoeca rosetta (strain ATCC 50818 / BSB-021) TaxID=946362 RepID=F2U7Q3_SALR5|nr:uncharacterized protein PTSG_04535 [Salpingoeca rosetta]EGD72808.1 hypothetical protein PTSG_04535 [Salpingoeca rosetta]|eukprot:XP_004994631.1 hypothetical protein PTSG_04535 [Salpingoeca rosetta]
MAEEDALVDLAQLGRAKPSQDPRRKRIVLNYADWKEWACEEGNMNLSPELAWVYFETFDLISEPGSAHRLKLTQKEQKQQTSEGIAEKLRSKIHVPMIEFLLFLFIQHYGRANFKTIDHTEELPPALSSPELKETYVYHITSLKRARLKFLRHHMEDIISLLLHLESYRRWSVSGRPEQEIRVPAAHVMALDWLIRVEGAYRPFSQVVLDQQHHRATGYSKITETFVMSALLTWVRDRLVLPPPAVLSEAKPLICVDEETGPAVLARLSRTTQLWEESRLRMRDVHISKCSVTILYILAPLRHVWIDECVRCTVVLGPVAGVLHISNSRRCTVVAPCVRFMARSVADTTAHLCTNTRPLLLDSTQDLTLAPYHTFYGALGRHLEEARILPTRNLWNHPIRISPSGWQPADTNLLDPQDLCPFVIPFDVPGDTVANPCALSPAYERGMLDNIEFVDQLKGRLRSAQDRDDIPQETVQQFEHSMHAAFLEWLMYTKRLRQVHDLNTTGSRPASALSSADHITNQPQHSSNHSLHSSFSIQSRQPSNDDLPPPSQQQQQQQQQQQAGLTLSLSSDKELPKYLLALFPPNQALCQPIGDAIHLVDVSRDPSSACTEELVDGLVFCRNRDPAFAAPCDVIRRSRASCDIGYRCLMCNNPPANLVDAFCVPVCGDGMVVEREYSCDDGNLVPGDGCDENCHIETGWDCDVGPPGPTKCTMRCGDRFRVHTALAQEECDDGNLRDGDGCSSTCTIEEGYMCIDHGLVSVCTGICGDGLKVPADSCDDGNFIDGDGCSSTCEIEPGWKCPFCDPELLRTSCCIPWCGDGRLVANEQCDTDVVPIKRFNKGGCDRNCKLRIGWYCEGEPSVCTTVCGDGMFAREQGSPEECDDGNLIDGDGCSSNCEVERGYKCIIHAEAPDTSDCTSFCGNGIILPNEECDDRNRHPNDGCTQCTVDEGYVCEGEPSECRRLRDCEPGLGPDGVTADITAKPTGFDVQVLCLRHTGNRAQGASLPCIPIGAQLNPVVTVTATVGLQLLCPGSDPIKTAASDAIYLLCRGDLSTLQVSASASVVLDGPRLTLKQLAKRTVASSFAGPVVAIGSIGLLAYDVVQDIVAALDAVAAFRQRIPQLRACAQAAVTAAQGDVADAICEDRNHLRSDLQQCLSGISQYLSFDVHPGSDRRRRQSDQPRHVKEEEQATPVSHERVVRTTPSFRWPPAKDAHESNAYDPVVLASLPLNLTVNSTGEGSDVFAVDVGEGVAVAADGQFLHSDEGTCLPALCGPATSLPVTGFANDSTNTTFINETTTATTPTPTTTPANASEQETLLVPVWQPFAAFSQQDAMHTVASVAAAANVSATRVRIVDIRPVHTETTEEHVLLLVYVSGDESGNATRRVLEADSLQARIAAPTTTTTTTTTVAATTTTTTTTTTSMPLPPPPSSSSTKSAAGPEPLTTRDQSQEPRATTSSATMRTAPSSTATNANHETSPQASLPNFFTIVSTTTTTAHITTAKDVEEASSSTERLTTRALAGIIAGAVCGVVVLAVIAVKCHAKKRARLSPAEQSDCTNPQRRELATLEGFDIGDVQENTTALSEI